jgi:hypothetical protein
VFVPAGAVDNADGPQALALAQQVRDRIATHVRHVADLAGGQDPARNYATLNEAFGDRRPR